MISFDLRSVLTLVFTADALVNCQIIRCFLSSKKEQNTKYLLIEQVGALLGMLTLYFVGVGVIYVLKTPEATVKFTAGLVILLSGLKAAFNKNDLETWNKSFKEDQLLNGLSLFVPLSMPLIIGPSWFSAALVLTTTSYPLSHNLSVICLSWLILSVSLLTVHGLAKKIFNDKGLKGLQTVMGLVITIIGVQILIEGLKLAFIGFH